MLSDPQVAVAMLGIFILVILLGFPIAFTLMAMGVMFGYYAYFDPERMNTIFDNRVFDLLVNQTYSVMANDVLTAVPLFLFMGYIVERANIVDRLFFTMNIAARRLPGSMAIAALATCAMFATATGIIGAVVTLMGLLAFPAMLKARYDTSFAAGVICAGGCLGILIPPSIMLIVYAATSNVSIVKLYAGAIFPGFLLAGLYVLYVMGRAWLNPSLAPKPTAEEVGDVTSGQVFFMLITSFFPLAFLILSVLGAILAGLATPSEAASIGALGGLFLAICYRIAAIVKGEVQAEWAGEGRDSSPWLEALGIGALTVSLFYAAYVVIFQSMRAMFFDVPVSLEGGLFGGPYVNVDHRYRARSRGGLSGRPQRADRPLEAEERRRPCDDEVRRAGRAGRRHLWARSTSPPCTWVWPRWCATRRSTGGRSTSASSSARSPGSPGARWSTACSATRSI